MTIFSDEVLMLTAAEMEEWYEHELQLRAELELRQQRQRPPGSTSTAVSLASLVGNVPANYSMFVSRPGQYTNFSDLTPFAPTFFGQTAGYGFANSSIGAPAVYAPDKTFTGQSWTEDNTNNQHLLYTIPQFAGTPNPYHGTLMTNVANNLFRCAAIAQLRERTRIVIQATAWDNVGMNALTASAGFDLGGVQTGYDNAGSSGFTVIGTSIKPLGGGWMLCLFDVLSTTPAPANQPYTKIAFDILMDAGTGTATRNTTYTGDGKSGVNIWWFNVLPRGAWPGFGFNGNVVFFDDFLSSSTIDLFDTGTGPVNWYTHADWPTNSEFAIGGNTTWFRNLNGPFPANRVSVSNSVMTFGPAITSSNFDLCTAKIQTPGQPGYYGQAWTIPALFECNMNEDLSIRNGLAFWTAATEELIGTLPLNSRYIEIDFMEMSGANGFGQGHWVMIDWAIQFNPPMDTTQSFPLGTADGGAIILPTGPVGFHTYSTLLLPMALNGGVFGTGWNFRDGIFNIKGDFSWSTTQSIIRNPTNIFAAGAFTAIERQHFPIFLGTGFGPSPPLSLSVDFVKVYQ